MKKQLLFISVLAILGLSANAQWQQTNGPYGGIITCLSTSGTNIFAGTNGGGVFLSSNNGSSWTEVNNGLTNIYVYPLAVSGTNIFAGTDVGVFLFSNNGSSWTAVNNGLPNNTYVRSLAVS
ncbi:MAG: regulator, partial [Bacteroidota bacterium]